VIKNMMAKIAKILICEDNIVENNLLSEFFVSHGYEVICDYDGTGVLEKVTKENPDIIILDIRLGKVDGLEICKRIKEERTNEFMPIVLVTAYFEGVRDKINALEIGADDILPKPFDLDELLARVRSLLKIKVLYERTQYLATHDLLTDTYNRIYLMNFLEKEEKLHHRYNTIFSFALVDIDNFKDINDTYGHQVGDKILNQIAAILKNTLREVDILARYGGDEFAVVFPYINKENAIKACLRILNSMNESEFSVNLPTAEEQKLKLRLTVSIGVASLPEDGASVDEIIHKADSALYKAKSSGKNCVCGIS